MRRTSHPLIAVCLITALLPWPAAAKTRKGEALIYKARQAELLDTTQGMEDALRLAQEALDTDRADIGYQLEVARLRAFAAQYHVYEGQVLRGKGQIKESIVEFEKAVALDPASIVAPQELERTRNLANELRRNPSANADDLLMRPLPRKNQRDERLYESSAPIPQLTVKLAKPLPVIKVNNQSSADVYQAVAKEAKLRVLFDSDYQPRPLGLNQVLDFQGASLDQALDYVALVTKSFWKPLSPDTIFVTNDDAQRRGTYEEQVTKSFYLTNAPAAQEVTDIANTVQRVTDIKKLLVHPTQGVIVVRSDPDRLALAEKIVSDLDKPKAEIIIDVIILSVSKNWERQLGINILGLADNLTGAVFNPSGVLNPVQAGGRLGIPLDTLQNLSKGDYNVNLPGAALNALLKIAGTKVLDKAQLRTIEGQKSVLKIGQRIPYATGSFSPGSFGGGSSLVNTQFQYFDVGLNIDVTAKVHEPDEVSLHIESDTSAVAERVDIGGIIQPVISQRKRVADVRVKEGEVNFWDIVTQRQDVKNTNGIPGLSQLPILGRVFSNEKQIQSELQVLTLLVPHIIRAPDIRNVNLMGLSSGSDQVVRMRYSTPEGRTVAAQSTDQVLELRPAPGAVAFGMQQPGMGGMQQPGMGGMQQPGMGGMQQPGMGGMQQPGMGGMQQPGMGGMQQPGMGGMQQPGMGGMQQPGMGGMQQPGMGGMQQPGMGGMQQPGMGGMQQPGMGGMQQPGMGGMQQPGMGGMQQPGMGGMQQPGMGGMQQPGMGGMQQPGMGGMQQPGMGSVQQPGMGGTQQPGMGGMGGASPQPAMPTGPGPTQPGPNPMGGTARLYFNPPSVQAQMNTTVTVELRMENGEGATGQVTVHFDPRMVPLAGVNPGSGVSVPGPEQVGRTTVQVNPGPGTRSIATFTFQCTSPGISTILIDPPRLTDSRGVEMPSTAAPLTIEIQGPRA